MINLPQKMKDILPFNDIPIFVVHILSINFFNYRFLHILKKRSKMYQIEAHAFINAFIFEYMHNYFI